MLTLLVFLARMASMFLEVVLISNKYPSFLPVADTVQLHFLKQND